jgi:hypothetical protein
MKHEIIRSKPVEPVVEKIVIELTRSELLGLARIVGHDVAGYCKPLSREVGHNVVASASASLYYGLMNAARGAGLTV